MKRLFIFLLVIILYLLPGSVNVLSQQEINTGEKTNYRFKIGFLGGVNYGGTLSAELNNQKSAYHAIPKVKPVGAFGSFLEMRLMEESGKEIILNFAMRYIPSKDIWEVGYGTNTPESLEMAFTYLEMPIGLKVKTGPIYAIIGGGIAKNLSSKNGETDITDAVNSTFGIFDFGCGLDFDVNEKTCFILETHFTVGVGMLKYPDSDADFTPDEYFKDFMPGGLRFIMGLGYKF